MLVFPAGTRSLGMGETGVAMGSDSQLAALNPANLAGMESPQASMTYLKGMADIGYGTLVYAQPFSAEASLGARLEYLNAGQMEFNGVDGSERLINAEADWLVSVSAGAKLPGGNSLGMGIKFFQSQLAEAYRAGTIALDAGMIFPLGDPDLQAGLAIRNLGPNLKYDQAGDMLPVTLAAGAAYHLRIWEGHQVWMTVETKKILDLDFKLHAGVEYCYQGLIMLRAGYRAGYDLYGVSVGCGFALGRLTMDYALSPMGDWGFNHWVSIKTEF